MADIPLFRGNPIHELPLKVNVDEASSTVMYVGYAMITAATSDAVWRIKKLVTTSTVTETLWADGNDKFDNIWDNRASLTYS